MKKTNAILLSIALMFTISCSILSSNKDSQRKPSSFTDTLFSELTKEISTNYQTLTSDSKQCATEMRTYYEKLFGLAGSSVYFDMDNIEILDRNIQQSFEARLLLKDSLRDFEIENSDDKRCFANISDVFKALRYIEDYMIEMRMGKTEDAPTEYINMQGQFPYLLINPRYADEIKSYADLKSGDAILSRGNAYSSAAIARIGESDYQFSHLSFVYRNPAKNKLYTTEAHIEVGSVAAPFKDHIDEKNSRSVVFRYTGDPQVAHQASEYIFKFVKAQSKSGKNIEYDFAMDYRDNSKLFCSEVLSAGFHHMLPNEEHMPKFKSHFDKGLVPFLQKIGIPVTDKNITTVNVFSPGDIQFDPRFDLVMEWRNPLETGVSRSKDFILTKLFEKMSKENYIIDSDFSMDAKTKTAWLFRRIPLVKKFLENKFPLNMSPDQLRI